MCYCFGCFTKVQSECSDCTNFTILFLVLFKHQQIITKYITHNTTIVKNASGCCATKVLIARLRLLIPKVILISISHSTQYDIVSNKYTLPLHVYWRLWDTPSLTRILINYVKQNLIISSNRKWQDYVYIQCEYKSTKQKIKHLLREENKVKENKIS